MRLSGETERISEWEISDEKGEKSLSDEEDEIPLSKVQIGSTSGIFTYYVQNSAM
jgi:hypothetical protein